MKVRPFGSKPETNDILLGLYLQTILFQLLLEKVSLNQLMCFCTGLVTWLHPVIYYGGDKQIVMVQALKQEWAQ